MCATHAFVIGSCLITCLGATAQSSPVPTLHVATRRIELPVSVLDKKTGQPVTTLTSADFRLSSDGANLPITYFGAPGHTRPLAVYLVIRNDPIDTTALRRLAKELPEALKVLPADTRIAIASYNGVNNSLWLHPTDDRGAVVAAMQQIVTASQFNNSKSDKKNKKTASTGKQTDSAAIDKATAKRDKAADTMAEKTGQPDPEPAEPSSPAPPEAAESADMMQTEPNTSAPPEAASTGASLATAAASTTPPPAAVVSDDISGGQSLKKMLKTYNLGSADAIHLVETDWDRYGDTGYQPVLIVIDDELSFCYVWYALKLHNELLRQGMTLDELQEPHGGFSRAMVGFTKVWAPTGIPLDPENAFLRYRYESYLAKASGGEVVSIRATGYKAGFTQLFSHARNSYQLEFEPPATGQDTGATALSRGGQQDPAVAADGTVSPTATTKDAARQASADAKLHSLHVELIARPGLDPAAYRILARNHYSLLNPIKPTNAQPKATVPAAPHAPIAAEESTAKSDDRGGSIKPQQSPQE